MLSFIAVALAGTSILAGCGTELESTRATRPVGSDFDQALYSDYVKLSAAELAEGDLRDADAFAVRAAESGRPRTVQPEELWARDIPPQHDIEMGLARVHLVNTLNATARNKAVKTSQAAPEAPAFEPRSYVVYFDFDSADLTGSARTVVDQAARYARRFPDAEVTIRVGGHTDTAGSKVYNLKLGEGRAKAVVQALQDAGIDEHQVSWVSKGEEEPAVVTADGVQTPLNRRATLDVTQ
jgi:outer membrane protein OmpA-like peptidoglycan-associated protein